MYGQYKSTLLCPKCKKYSYAFDPFNCLSLPIPQNAPKKIQIVFIPYNYTKKMTSFNYIVDSSLKISELIQKVITALKKDTLDIIPMYSKDLSLNMVEVDQTLETIRCATLYFYEFPSEFSEFISIYISKDSGSSLECYPRIIGIKRQYTHIDVHKTIIDYLKPFIGKGVNDNHLTLYENKVYKICYDPGRANPCIKCLDKRCQGCEMIPDTSRIAQYIKSKNYFSLHITFLANSFRKNIDFSPLKQIAQAKIYQEDAVKQNITIDE